MMMQQPDRKTKRAFSLTELLIIIAVIGILAAIIIPSFLGVEDKTEMKSDQNTVETLNVALDNAKALKKDVSTLASVREHLAKAGYSDQSLKPQHESTDADIKYCFVWDQSLNAILMINLYNDDVIYPENFKDTINDGDWYFIEYAPTDANNMGAYPSEIGYARESFAKAIESDESFASQNSMYAMQVHLPAVNYDGKEYERPACIAWAIHEKNGTYPDGTHGSRLGDINIVNAQIHLSEEYKLVTVDGAEVHDYKGSFVEIGDERIKYGEDDMVVNAQKVGDDPDTHLPWVELKDDDDVTIAYVYKFNIKSNSTVDGCEHQDSYATIIMPA